MKFWAIIFAFSITTGTILRGQTAHPNLLITSSDVSFMKKKLGKYPLFDQTFKELKELADKAIAEPMDVPLPKDPAGAYTHERHKYN